MKISICQINVRLGDLEYNSRKIITKYKNACEKGSDLVIFPEMSLSGVGLHDLVLNPDFLSSMTRYIKLLAKETESNETALIFGAPLLFAGKIYNAAFLAYGGEIKETILKHNLVTHGVFNEPRNFSSGTYLPTLNFKDEKIGILINEDIWFEDAILNYISQGVNIICSMNASPYDMTKSNIRKHDAKSIVCKYKLLLIYVNLMGGQDDIIFDGGSFIMDRTGEYILEPLCWDEVTITYDTKLQTIVVPPNKIVFEQIENIYQALMLYVRDYVDKNKFETCVMGLSGGVDSALVASIIVDALGSRNLHALMMPTEFTSNHSLEDAALLASNINCRYEIIDITQIYHHYLQLLSSFCAGSVFDTTEENLQARIRGMVLMAISNKCKELVVTTCNKSESLTGHATLYGDTCGAFALIKDVYKTKIYELIRWRNSNVPYGSKFNAKNFIPARIFIKEPSAELKADQKDRDILPPYSLLDKMLEGLVEQDLSVEDIAQHLNIATYQVKEIRDRMYHSEFKRSQCPIGPKISIKSFTSDRKYPINIFGI